MNLLKSLMAALIAIITLLGLPTTAWACDYSSAITTAYSGDTWLDAGYATDSLVDGDSGTYWGTFSPANANTWWEGVLDASYTIYGASFVAEVQSASSDTWTVELGYTPTGSIADYIAVSSWTGTVNDGDTVTISGVSFTAQYPVIYFTSSSYAVAATDLQLLGSDCDGDSELSLAAGGSDCNDEDASVYTGAADSCDGVDSDCDGTVEQDGDGDGSLSCEDCDDADSSVYPGAAEACDGFDNDCDGSPDSSEVDSDGDGQMACAECNDSDVTVYVGASELCDGQDNDCDGNLWSDEADADGDDYVVCAEDAGGWDGASTPTGFGDCDDGNASRNPGASEVVYDGLDNDCDSSTPDDDLDGDGYLSDTDCNDADPDINPGEAEICNGADENCDGSVDEGYPDADGNGIIDCQETDDDGDGYAEFEGDCNDGDENINPGEAETCNFIDDNCDGQIDEGLDTDADGYTDCAGDCVEGDAGTYPGAPEVCDEQDNNCNGQTDEGFDVDGDGYASCAGDCDDEVASVYPGAEEVCGDTVDQDCDGEDLECPDTGDTGIDTGDTGEVTDTAADSLFDGKDAILVAGSCGCSGAVSGPVGGWWLLLLCVGVLGRRKLS